ncbi:hypothetical protein Tco_1420790 [Tanacetum coccineum]
MGRGTWYYSLGVSSIVDAFVRVDGRSHLLSGEIAGSEANRIIRDSKLREFSFYLVPLSYGSIDVADLVGFTPRRRIGFRMELVQGVTPICKGSCRLASLERQEVWNDCRSCKVRDWSEWVHKDDVAKTVFRMRNRHIEVYGYAFWVKQCTSGFHGVNEPGGVRVAREDDHGVTEGREDVREVFQRRGSGAKRKISRCGRNQMDNGPILALPEGADDFVYHLGKANVVVESWSRKKSEAKNEFWIDVTVLWAITGEVELNGSNLVQETTNKIVVGYGWLKVSPREKLDVIMVDKPLCFVKEPLSCGPRGHELKHNMIVLAKVRGDLKRGLEFTWERKDQIRSKCPQLFVDCANALSS